MNIVDLDFFSPIAFSLVLSFICVKLALRYFPQFKFLDKPRAYGLKRSPVPYGTGIVFFIVFLVSTVLFVDVSKQIVGVLLASFLITFVSFIDDRIKLSIGLRLTVQVLAALLVVLAGVKIQLISNPFGNPILLDSLKFNFLGEQIWVFSAIFIVFWLVMMMNVMNWLDGIPGLASGVSTIAQFSLFLLAIGQTHVTDQSAIITISGVLAASTFMFLIFDFHPPKLLMGDSGSMFLGFMLGVLSILAGGKLATAILIMGFPILDAFWVIFKRILKGKAPVVGDYTHFHHILLRVGLSERNALIFNYSVCFIFAVIALFLDTTFSKFLAFVGVFILMAAVTMFLNKKSERSR